MPLKDVTLSETPDTRASVLRGFSPVRNPEYKLYKGQNKRQILGNREREFCKWEGAPGMGERKRAGDGVRMC